MALTLRVATHNDVPAMLAIYAPYVLETTISFETEVPSEEEFARRLEEFSADFPWLVAEQDGHIIGYAYAHKFAARAAYGWTAESSVYVATDGRGRGVGRILYTVLEELLTLQGYRSLCAIVTHPNPGSEEFHKRMGFSHCGTLPGVGYKFGKTLDTNYFHKPLAGKQGDEKPTPFPALEAAEVQNILTRRG